MAFSAVAFGAAAATAAGAILKFESENVLQDGPSALLNPSPKGAVPSIAQAIARQTCRRYADGVPGLDERTAVDLETVCRPYLDNIGYGGGPTLRLPFRGGQCPKRYLINFTVQTGSSCADEVGFPVTQDVELWGPILGTYQGPNTCPPGFVERGPVGIIAHSVAGGERLGSPVEAQLNGSASSITINSIQVVFSGVGVPLTDDCGDPDPVFTEPEPPGQPGPDTEPFNPSPDIDINIEVNLRPDSLIEVNFGLGPIVVPVFGGGGDGGGGDGSGGGDRAPGVPEAGPEVPGGNGGFGGDDGFGPPPAGRRWVGACVRIIPEDNRQPPIPGSAPEDVYPLVIGNCRLVYDAFGSRVVDTPVQIRAKGVCLWESVRGLNPVAVNVDLTPGYSYAYRPYSVPLEN